MYLRVKSFLPEELERVDLPQMGQEALAAVLLPIPSGGTLAGSMAAAIALPPLWEGPLGHGETHRRVALDRTADEGQLAEWKTVESKFAESCPEFTAYH
jgi:hypothetical protein